ncbi:MAG: hypothetical protein A2W84_10605 [Bacteroidetes bacterium GWC2_40_13]|nr:MAG: hypothetical protein A2W84_10605 [Bacteroidetes bacterium GWC2_40_13]
MATRSDQILSIFAPMTNRQLHILLVWLLVLGCTNVWAQAGQVSTAGDSTLVNADSTIPDSLGHPQDTLKVLPLTNHVDNDTLRQKNDTTLKASKWDFLTGGNDSTYYSFYGHLLNVDDSIIVKHWTYNTGIHELTISAYDSSLYDFHQHQPGYRYSINNSYLGNIGLAMKSNIYFDPQPATDFLFMQSFSAYTFQRQNVDYYNVAKPFTKFGVNIGPKDEQDIDIVHTQNVNRYLNFSAHFKNYSGEGFYVNQKTRNNAGVFGASYTQGRLATHFNYIFNKVDVQENGGITDTYFVTGPTLATKLISTRLTGGTNYFKDQQLFIDQKIGFLKTHVPDSATVGEFWFSLQYSYEQQKSSKIYTDESHLYQDLDGNNFYLYPNTYNASTTFDTCNFKIRKQNIRINLEENPRSYPFIGAYVGVGTEKMESYFFNKDTLFNYSHAYTKKSQYFEGGMYRQKGEKFSFLANYLIYLTGYKQGDFQMYGNIRQKFGSGKNQVEAKAEGGQYRETPDYFLQRYYSNHYRWQNNLNPQYRTELKFGLDIPGYHTKMGTRFSILKDYIYFDESATPAQYTNAFSVFDLYIDNRFDFWKFGTITRLNYQKTTNDRVLPLPEFSGYFSLFFQPDIYFKDTEGRMKFQLGVDVTYWTKFHGPAYSPALALFYNQSEQSIGNYPYVGAFWNFEIKRLRFYLRGEHLNYGYMERNYFIASGYPSNRFVLRYGLVWTFYD